MCQLIRKLFILLTYLSITIVFPSCSSENNTSAISSKSKVQKFKKRHDLPVIESTDIQGVTIDQVWDVLVDFDNYHNMNDWVKIEGDPEIGETISARPKSIRGPSLKLKITSIVSKGDKREICWDDVTWFTKYGFDGWRCRYVKKLNEENGVRLINHFEYTGKNDWALDIMTRRYLVNGMKLENESLKRYLIQKFVK